MPKCWLTVHWPHPAEFDHPWNIYFPEDTKSEPLGRQIAVGDRVAFYETRNGKDTVGEPPLPYGRSGVVVLATVTAPYRERRVTIRHTDGTVSKWQGEVPCEKRDCVGFCPRSEAAVALGHKPGFKFFGVGHGLGVKRIDCDGSERLRKCFKGHDPEPIQLRQ
jgi:hypothetical protein